MPPARSIAALLVVALAGAPFAQPKPTTPLFVCGEDEKSTDPNPMVLRWENIALATDGRVYSPCAGIHSKEHREIREALLLLRAAVDPRPEFRRLAAQAHGRLGKPEYITLLMRPIAKNPSITGIVASAGPSQDQPPALDDVDASVRSAAANGIADLLSGLPIEPLEGPPPSPNDDQLKIGRLALEARLRVETEPFVAGTILEALGRLKYPDDIARDEVETNLVAHATGQTVQILGAVRGIEVLIRGNPKRQISPVTRQRLRECAAIGPTLTAVPTMAGRGTAAVDGEEERLARVRRTAVLALQQAQDDDLDTLMRTLRDADWQVRRLAATRIDPGRAEFQAAYEQLAADPAFQVRYELAGAASRLARQTHDCDALLKLTSDPSIPVASRAIDELPNSCAEPKPVIDRLLALGATLKDAAPDQPWHLPAHAFVALARLDREAAMPILEIAAVHAAWPVRAAAATAAGHARNEAMLVTLAADREPNVRTAALEALYAMKSPAVTAAAVHGLESDDKQLLFTAANALKGTPEGAREEPSTALIMALLRLTRQGADTSRDARVAILDRLGEIMLPEHGGLIAPLAADFDARVRDALGKAWASATGAAMPPASSPQHRYPLQPAIADFQVPSRALIKMMGGGTIELLLLTRDAPLTVVRFVELVRARYYDGQLFYRVVPNVTIGAGSPAANDQMGADRFWRDETGLTHTRGAIGLGSHGHDTGDGRFFIDLSDQPQLDHVSTVFARVIAGLDVVDTILEGARIESITLKDR